MREEEEYWKLDTLFNFDWLLKCWLILWYLYKWKHTDRVLQWEMGGGGVRKIFVRFHWGQFTGATFSSTFITGNNQFHFVHRGLSRTHYVDFYRSILVAFCMKHFLTSFKTSEVWVCLILLLETFQKTCQWTRKTLR